MNSLEDSMISFLNLLENKVTINLLFKRYSTHIQIKKVTIYLVI